jgi:hypothetical protein
MFLPHAAISEATTSRRFRGVLHRVVFDDESERAAKDGFAAPRAVMAKQVDGIDPEHMSYVLDRIEARGSHPVLEHRHVRLGETDADCEGLDAEVRAAAMRLEVSSESTGQVADQGGFATFEWLDELVTQVCTPVPTCNVESSSTKETSTAHVMRSIV